MTGSVERRIAPLVILLLVTLLVAVIAGWALDRSGPTSARTAPGAVLDTGSVDRVLTGRSDADDLGVPVVELLTDAPLGLVGASSPEMTGI